MASALDEPPVSQCNTYNYSISVDPGQRINLSTPTASENSDEDFLGTGPYEFLPGTITVIKNAKPNDPQDFWFNTAFGYFCLDDDSDPALSNKKTFEPLWPGTYIINETTLDCWNLTNISCSGNASVKFGNGMEFHDYYTPGDTSVEITLGSGNASTCTFTNTKKVPVIQVTKTADYSMDNSIKHVGTNITYWINVTNVGEVRLDPVTITDPMIDLDYTLPEPLEPGESEILTHYYVVDTEDEMCSGIPNTVVVNATGCGEEVSDTDTWLICAYVNGSFAVTLTADTTYVDIGDPIYYTINVTNTGNMNITDINVTSTLTSGSGIVVTQFPIIDCLTPEEIRFFNTNYTTTTDDADQNISNVATATGCGPCGGYDNINDSDEWTVNPSPVDPSHFFEVRKIALNKTVQRCDEITYLIQIRSDFGTLENVTVKDVFNKDVEFVSASPEPDDDGIWRFAKVNVTSLPADETDSDWKTLITLTVKVPDKQDFEYDMAQGVTGEGFVNVKNDYSTTYKSYVITNCIELTTDTIPGQVFKDCVSVTVTIDPGTELSTREHGSGTYESEELVAVRTENKSISMDKDMAATYSSTTLGLYNNRTVTYSSRWTEEANAKNRVTGTSLSEQYRYATTIDRESSFFLDENESVMNIDSEFDGMGHIGFLKMETNSSTYHDTPTAEIREDYVGSFKVLEHADEYGSGVSYEKTTTGSGFVVGDRRVGESQRSYESGTGTYDSEEIIETATNYIAKDISLVYAPMNQSLTDDVSISASQKWKEGMYSTTPQTSYIGEEFTSLDYLDKETIAKGINEMNTEASFEGRARFRALLESSNQSEPLVDFDEQYDGDYSIERNVLFTGVPKYDKPHLNVTKTLDSLVEEDDGDEEREVATYTITIENDGNEGLEPVHVTDYFPPGASFIDSSLRPDEVTDTFANWTLTHLNIGDVAAITLRLDVTSYHPDELVNTVVVCGDYDNENETVCARNYSALEIDWLTCCPSGPVSVTTTAELDEENENVVRYSVEIRNAEDVTRVATVTDWLPDGMELIDSSIPFASYDGGVVVWNLIDIEPLGTETIEFSALAPGDGRFTNTVEVDPRSVDGPVVQPVSASCVIDVGIVEDECGSVSCDSWQPPNWEFEHYGYGSDETSCEDLSCASCDGTDYILAP